MVERGIEADAAILGEPTDLGLGVAHFGSVRYTVSVAGKRSHAARPDHGVNAVEGIRGVLNRVRDLNEAVGEADHEYLDAQSIKPTMLDAGVGGNVIPDEASAVIDWRFHPGPEEESAFAERLRDLFADVTIDGNDADIDLDLWQFTRGAEIDPDEPVVNAIREGARDLGYDPQPFGGNYGADTPHLIHTGGIPTVLFGPGSIDDAHSIDESIAAADLRAATDIYGRAIERFFAVR